MERGGGRLMLHIVTGLASIIVRGMPWALTVAPLEATYGDHHALPPQKILETS